MLIRRLTPVFRPRRVAHVNHGFWSIQRRCLGITTSFGNVGQYRRISPVKRPWKFYATCAVILGAVCSVTYETSRPFRHVVLAVVRCSRVAGAAINSAIDYKVTMLKKYDSTTEENEAYSECHTRSAHRVLMALLANGGIFIKLGQHMASLVVLPVEWTNTMKVLQDKCEPTPYEDLEALFANDMDGTISDFFFDFDPRPIGVASLAQVHIGHHKESGQLVAVKLQHPHLSEFCDVDMKMVEATLGWIKYWFPEFEFSWLGEEMRTNLPKEMDFTHEASNAARTAAEFANLKTSLYIPEVILAKRRVLIMEYIEGGRVDDLKYLAACNIDRNKVAIELSRIFSQMVFVNGWFHADPHPGNLLIRPANQKSRSPYNFEIVLLDHGLYFDLDRELRINYCKLWLSLIARASPTTLMDRRKYAELVGNIGPDLYPVFEAAITGRLALKGSWEDMHDNSFRRATGMIDVVPQSEEEKDAIRNAVMQQEGVLLSVFDVLRRIPRRVLMVLKLNDLTRSLDHALMTTHSNIRIFLVTAKYCLAAVWQDERKDIFSMHDQGFSSFKLLSKYLSCWWAYEKAYIELSVVEIVMDFQAYLKRKKEWIFGLFLNGTRGAHEASFGLVVSVGPTQEMPLSNNNI
ncbi:ABC1 family-domain-containing protein [Gymnopilus junonius]|uniref:ABC1 family-domain-containing protein n=1 Tax=Gymnopilus junonius TaxID=109634 RepID=A0A9P5TRW7_GYMJU|nr:ABC1 family-domain-containing protein [Gymnopilus junonius]